jgi:hypothetical protein
MGSDGVSAKAPETHATQQNKTKELRMTLPFEIDAPIFA